MKPPAAHGLLLDRRVLSRRLSEAGLSPAAAKAKAGLFERAATALSTSDPTGDAELLAFFVPGRIEVLGKHTDYAGGRSMVAAVERGFCTVASPRGDSQVTLRDALSGDAVQFELRPDLAPRPGHWSNYAMTVGRRIARNFPGAVRGADAAFVSDLPPAADMSSSSALVVAAFLVLSEVNRLPERPEYRTNITDQLALAGYLGTIENGQGFGTLAGDRGVGTFGGSEDHTAILCARAGHVLQCAYCPVRFEAAIPLPQGYVFAVGSSGVAAEKTGAARDSYNRASGLATALADLWRRATGRGDLHLAAALASEPDAAERFRSVVAGAGESAAGFPRAALMARLEHFIVEDQEVIPAAGQALANGDLPRFGEAVDRSQKAAEELLGNQVPETIHLAASARRLGAVAASAFGAGFGGSVWSLVEAGRAEALLAAWSAAYHENFPQHAQASTFFLTSAGPAAFRVC